MTPAHLYRLSCVAVWTIVALLSSATAARAQLDLRTPPEAAALSTAITANPELVQGLAKELGSTPEQAAGVAGVLFGIAKSLLKPEDFAAVSNAVPGMTALLATVPPGVVGTSGSALTPGFASSSSFSSTTTTTTTPTDATASASSAFPKLGIPPDMIAKAVPFLSGYLKKYGGSALGPLLEGLFKTGK